MIECTNCGCKNHFEGAAFCKKCGVALSTRLQAMRPPDAGPADRLSKSLNEEETAEAPRQAPQHVISQSVAREAEQDAAIGTGDNEELQIETTADLLMPDGKRDPPKAADSHRVLSEKDRSDLIRSLELHLTRGRGGPTPDKPQAPKERPSPAAAKLTRAGVDLAAKNAEDFALLSGKKLLLPKSANLLPGEKIKCGGKEFIVRALRRDLRSYGLRAALAVLLISALLSQWFRSSGSNKAALFGLVVDSLTMAVLPEATVTIPELNLHDTTDGHGSFGFGQLEEGSYRVRIECRDFAPTDMPLQVEKGTSQLLRVSLSPLTLPGAGVDEVATLSDAERQAAATPANGTLKIRTNVTDVSIILNDQHLGSGDQTFERIKPGKHTLRLEKDGFETYRQEITISPGKTVEVVADLLATAARQADEFTAEAYFQKAEKFFEARRYEEAVGYYSLAIAKDANLAEAYERQAEANLMLGAKLKARADLLAAAKIYAASGRYADAITCHDRILGIAPESVVAFQQRGWAKITSGDLNGGLADLRAALSLDEDDWRARFQLARAYYSTGDHKSAEKHLKKIRMNSSELPLINGYLALAYLGKGDESDARKYFDKFSEQAASEDWSRMAAEPGWQRLLTLAAQDD